MEFLESNIFLIALTFLVFWGARKLQQRTGWDGPEPYPRDPYSYS